MKYITAVICFMAVYANVSAHGVEALGIGDRAEAVQIMYSMGEPMAYAEIKVFSPSSPKVETISGYADGHGKYAFIPDEGGQWRVEAADGMGHKAVITIDCKLEAGQGSEERGGGKTPLFFKALFGISLILNIFAGYYIVLRKKGVS